MVGLFVWIWRRISDWYTTLDLLEAFGWKAVCAAMLAGGSAGFLTFLNDAPGHTVFLAFLGSGLFVLGLVHLWYSTHIQKTASEPVSESAGKPSPLKIEFSDDWTCSEFVKEPAPFGQDTVSRKMVWVNLKNSSDYDVRNVRAEISSFASMTETGMWEPHPLVVRKTFPLQFLQHKTELDFSPRMGVRLYLISYTQYMLPGFIRIEGPDKNKHENQFLHSNEHWKFTVTVTANTYLPVQRSFMAWVDAGGLLVKTLDEEVA